MGSNPYMKLRDAATRFANKCISRQTKEMCYFPKKDLTIVGFDLREVYEKVIAAGSLGWDVQLVSTERGLEVKYIEKLPRRPYEF